MTSLQNLIKLTGLLFCLLIFSHCSRIFLASDVKNTPTHCFDMLWQTVNDKYAYFDYKKIDWQAVRQKYRPRIHDTMSQDSLFTVLAATLSELRDGHVNLYAGFDRSRYWAWKDDYPDNFNASFVYRNYLGRDFRSTGSLPNQMLADSIGYIRYSSFGNPISEADLDFVLKRFDKTQGIIIDVRDNGGGSMANIFKIMARFVDKKTLIGYTQHKNGKNKNDFSKKQPMYAVPKKNYTPYLKPIVVLVNRGCYSATTHFAAYMSLLPNVTIVGDRTGGGGGMPVSCDLPNGWQYRFSATNQTLPDSSFFEHGLDPDILIGTSAKDELEKRDAMIEKAMEVVKERAIKQKKGV
jgi:Peptidase family S41/Tricorn protease C1 domain